MGRSKPVELATRKGRSGRTPFLHQTPSTGRFVIEKLPKRFHMS